MIFKGILPEALASGVVKAVTPQEGGSTEMSGALAKLIAQNPEIIDRLKKEQPVNPQPPDLPESSPSEGVNRPATEIPFFDEFRDYQKRLEEEAFNRGEFRVGPAVITPVEYEGVVYNFGDGLSASDFKDFLRMRQVEQNQPGPEIIDRATVFPSNPPATQNPFQRPTDAPPVARALPMPEPNQIAAGPALTPMGGSSPFFRGQQAANLALTPAEALAMARNPFNRPR
jgi:hypothetical protein